MHPRKKEMVFAFAATCGMVLFFTYATIRKPHLFFAAFLVAFLVSAALVAYRVFAFSDDWYRAQEQGQQLWHSEHPRLSVCLSVLAVVGFVLMLVYFVRPLFR